MDIYYLYLMFCFLLGFFTTCCTGSFIILFFFLPSSDPDPKPKASSYFYDHLKKWMLFGGGACSTDFMISDSNVIALTFNKHMKAQNWYAVFCNNLVRAQ